MHRPSALLLVLALIGSACLSPSDADVTESPRGQPVVSRLQFTWDDLVDGSAVRTVDVAMAPTAVAVVASHDVETDLGILAVDTVTAPTLDGRRLVDRLPPGSSLTIRPDGTVQFAYWDLFDPRWRGREPHWEALDGEEGTIRVDRVDGGTGVAKVETAASLSGEGFFVDDPDRGDVFAFEGELRYSFSFGRPVRSLDLTDPAGHRSLFDVPPGFEVRVSADGDTWTTLWSAEGEGETEPKVTLPPGLEGAEGLCVAFAGGEGFAVARRLALTVVFDAGDLTELTRFPPGPRTLTYNDSAQSSHRAVLFWSDPGLGGPSESAAAEEPRPVVDEGDGRLTVTFPAGTRLRLRLDAAGAPVGIVRADAAGITILAGRADDPADLPTLTRLGPASHPGESFDWEAYRRTFYETGVWPSQGTRDVTTFDLAAADFEGVSVEGDEAVFTWAVDTADASGRVQMIVSEEKESLGGGEFTGLGVRWRVSGLPAVEQVGFSFPMLLQPGERSISQTFRRLEEETVTFGGPPRRPAVAWFGQSQSFVFTTGPGRTVVAAFDTPLWATVTSVRDGGRDRYRFSFPLGAGQVRETPTLRWLVAPAGAPDRWTAADLWSRIYEDLRRRYLTQAGVVDTPTLPTLIWNQPLDDEFLSDLEGFVATGDYPETGWFDRYTDRMLDRVAAARIPSIIIQAPWTSDAEDPAMVSSFHAPRTLTVSPMLGGVDGLARLVDEAHRRGIAVVLWYPSSYSIRSPLFDEHPDWLVWTRDGRPDDGGWGDVLVVDKDEGYRRYVIDQLTELHRAVPFDGVWMDSWVGIAVPTDYSEPQPAPRLDQAVALQRAFTDLGLSQIVIEGLGPLGRGDAYGDYETYAGPPDPLPDQIADMERLRGREYLLYRIGAGVYLDIDVYERALAAGGAAHVANLDEVDALDAPDRDRFRRLNVALASVVDEMDERTLLVADDRWVGVTWRDTEADATVVYAFEGFRSDVEGNVADVTNGTESPSSGPFTFAAHHVYVISP